MDSSKLIVELITLKNKRGFIGYYPERFYTAYDKLVPELIPPIKGHIMLLMLAGIKLTRKN